MPLHTTPLSGVALDKEVARLRGVASHPSHGALCDDVYSPSTSWAQCGEIMDEHNMATERRLDARGNPIRGDRGARAKIPYINGFFSNEWAYGATVPEAVCRCFVAFAQEKEVFNSQQISLFA